MINFKNARRGLVIVEGGQIAKVERVDRKVGKIQTRRIEDGKPWDGPPAVWTERQFNARPWTLYHTRPRAPAAPTRMALKVMALAAVIDLVTGGLESGHFNDTLDTLLAPQRARAIREVEIILARLEREEHAAKAKAKRVKP